MATEKYVERGLLSSFMLASPRVAVESVHALPQLFDRLLSSEKIPFRSIISGFAFAMALQVSVAAQAQTSTTFYIGAHEDDWQLFMTPNAAYDVRDTSNKTVFVYLTAGDMGCGTGCPSPIGNVPYYRVREAGANNSALFLATLNGGALVGTSSTVTINGHPLYRYALGPTVSYYLRLPDGNPAGTGYPTTGSQSLLLLETGQISSIAAVDGSTSYSSWTDLVNTLTALIKAESKGPDVWVNTQDPSSTTNPGDHQDHYATGAAAQAAANSIACVNQAYFVDYNNSSRAVNLNTVDSNMQSANFGTVVATTVSYGVGSIYLGDQGWLGKNYLRTVSGNGSCP